MKNTLSVINYIFRFLCRDESCDTANFCAYCRAAEIPSNKKIVVVRSDFFDDGIYSTELSLPKLPLKDLAGIPLLFGENKVEHSNGQVVIHADIIASTFFLISRYEEMVRPDVRDKHGRFPGKESLPCRAGFIDRPIVDEYGKWLRAQMRSAGIQVAETSKGFSSVYLTHDIDIPWEDFNLYTAVKRVMGILSREHRLNIYPLKNFFGFPSQDPLYTFDYIVHQDSELPNATSLYFIKSGGKSKPEDSSIYIKSMACKRLLNYLTSSGAELGYHVSYEAGLHPQQIAGELNTLNDAAKQSVTYSRNHYLCSRDPQDFNYLIDAGITDDFTMGYADVAGFRLGTCHAVRWVDASTLQLKNLTLHPLSIMDCTLFETDKMHFASVDDAGNYSALLIDNIFENCGELSLLWHNTVFLHEREKKMYSFLLNLVTAKIS